MALYDTIGATYAVTRGSDPRIAAQVRATLTGMNSVVNVGAGTASYEPPHAALAVEPSAVMAAQRPTGSAPAVRARAGVLPLDYLPEAAAVDRAMAVPMQDLLDGLPGATVAPAPVPHDCLDEWDAGYRLVICDLARS